MAVNINIPILRINNKILGQIRVTPPNPKVGESVCIEVLSPDGTLCNESGTDIYLNRAPGVRHWRQWRRPGTHRLRAVARHADGSIEMINTNVTVATAAPGNEPPRLAVSGHPHRHTEFQMSVVHTEAEGVRVGLPKTPTFAGLFPRRAAASQVAPKQIRIVMAQQPLPTKVPPRTVAAGFHLADSPIAYAWDFGDGTTLQTTEPWIDHDFVAALDTSTEQMVFHIQVRMTAPGQPPQDVRRSVTVANHYAMAKRRGLIQPLVVNAAANAQFTQDGYRGSFTVRNLEPVALAFTSRRIELMFSDHRPAVMLDLEALNVALPPKAETIIHVLSTKIPVDAIGFAVHYSGLDSARRPVRASAYFDLPAHIARITPHLLANPALNAQLNNLVAQRQVQNPTSIKALDILQVVQRGGLVSLPKAPPNPPGPPKPNIVEGGVCDPWNLPANIPEGFVCQASTDPNDTSWLPMPGRFMNARKGDMIITAATPGDMIADLLLSIGQVYSHSGMMTTNREQITHSTASKDRLLDYPNGSLLGTPAPSDGFKVDELRYLWPGVITQTVENSVNGQDFVDPESSTGKTFNIGGFGTINSMIDTQGDYEPKLVQSLVIKPDPTQETPAIRSQLHAIADWAAAQAGKSYYSFYCYTNPATDKIAPNPASPLPSPWWHGTYPTVCASFVWRAVHQSGAVVENQKDPKDAGANSKDGLYLYTAAERLVAGNELFDALEQLVDDSVAPNGVLAELASSIADMEDDVANQVCNAFNSDWCETESKDSDQWRQQQAAYAISPENLLRWNAPLYGYSEPLVYATPRYEQVTIYRWKKVPTQGSLAGKVMFNGAPVSGAWVQLYDGKGVGTKSDGSFSLDKIPAGNYIADVGKTRNDGMYIQAKVPVSITAGKTTQVNVVLQLSSDLYRALEIDGWVQTTDHECNAAVDPTKTSNMYRVLLVGPYNTHAAATFQAIADQDVLGEAIFEADWQLDKSVKIKVTLRVHDGTKTSDSYYEYAHNFTVAAGKSLSKWMYANDGDKVFARFTLKNKQAAV
ncbi:MAG: hypothetical protein FDX21_11625 [Chlorobium sp.]|nr:MAG: hypothetical protein FDX21_11625 [Chlorobium sp.]